MYTARLIIDIVNLKTKKFHYQTKQPKRFIISV
jgi:hypothetical protein